MKKTISINENSINLVIEVTEDGDVNLMHFSQLPYEVTVINENNKRWYRLVELQIAGEDHDDHHGSKHTGSKPGNLLKYKEHRDYRNIYGRKIEIMMEDSRLKVKSNIQFYEDVSVIRSWTEVTNIGIEDREIEYISSFCLTGISKDGISHWDEKSKVHIAHNTWLGEAQWKSSSLQNLGLSRLNDFSMKRVSCSSTGTWSSSEYLPMGCYENTECGTSLLWQIENNGSWHWEISDIADELYLQLSGPTEDENHWCKRLKPGETFISVTAAISIVIGDIEKAVGEITKYRRIIRRSNKDNVNLPVIFNDYMNCLKGDPTTEKLLPLINAAAEAGCEYFCIDCGWYSDGPWWDGVGEWLPSKERFPGGIKEPINYIIKKGMVPGLWLEIEVIGVKCPLANKVPDDWFFKRHGKRVIDHARYQLDFRNAEVVKHADEVINRLVNEYGIGYIKMDYNINAGIGTETDAYSFGDGLLEHNRAYLKWLDKVFERYPDLVIENCGSGGMRMDYSLLSRHSIQSSSDQTDYIKNANIAASVLTAVTPEQCAVWSYPLRDGDSEEVIFNMINTMLMRVHQSGQLAEISRERFELVKEGIDCYKNIRKDIPNSLPFWPIGFPNFSDEWISLGMKSNNKIYLAVWRLHSHTDSLIIPIKQLKGKMAEVRCAYPSYKGCNYKWNKDSGLLTVQLPQNNCARLFEII